MRMSKVVGAFLAASLFVLFSAGCGGHKASGPFAIKKGMREQRVLAIAGTPYATSSYSATSRCWLFRGAKTGEPIDGIRNCDKSAGSYAAGSHYCWLYRASRKGTPIDGITVCFKGRRAVFIQTSIHL